jgi:hypothetical protein
MISNMDSVAEYDMDRKVNSSILQSRNSSFLDDSNITPPTTKKGCGISTKGPGSTVMKGSSRTSHQLLAENDLLGFDHHKDKIVKSLNSQKTGSSDHGVEPGDFIHADRHENMAAVMKKVSSNLSRLSKQQKTPIEGQKSNSNNFSLASKSSLSRSKSREKADTQKNLLGKSNLVEKLKSGGLSNNLAAKDRIEDGFKKKSYYNILKTSCKEHAEKRLAGTVASSQLLQKKKIESKVSNRVLDLIKNNHPVARSCKDPSSRESSKSAQRSIKEKSAKSQKSNSLTKKGPGSLKLEKKEPLGLLSRAGVIERPKSASKSTSRTIKEKKYKTGLSEKFETGSNQLRKIAKPKTPLEGKETAAFHHTSNPLESLLLNKNYPAKQNSDSISKESNMKLLDLFKRTNLSDFDDQNQPGATRKRTELVKTAKSKKDEPIQKSTVLSTGGTKSEHTKPIAKPLGEIVKPNALSFKDFTSSVFSGNNSTSGATSSQNKKKKTTPTSQTSGNFTGKASPEHDLAGRQKEKRSTSQKRQLKGALNSNTNVFSNSYLVTHVHQVNNFINKG